MTTATNTPDVFTTLAHAAENANAGQLPRTALIAILSTGTGQPSAVRAVFGDCPLETLERAAAFAGLAPGAVRRAYAVAKMKHHAHHAELEDLIAASGIRAAQTKKQELNSR
jgi:hypothetical protein